jgi:hypothetical protein
MIVWQDAKMEAHVLMVSACVMMTFMASFASITVKNILFKNNFLFLFLENDSSSFGWILLIVIFLGVLGSGVYYFFFVRKVI